MARLPGVAVAARGRGVLVAGRAAVVDVEVVDVFSGTVNVSVLRSKTVSLPTSEMRIRRP